MSPGALRHAALSSILICSSLVGCGASGTGIRSSTIPAAAPAPKPVAIVDGVAITAAELAEHVRLTGLERKAAREDLIELSLMRRAAAAHKLTAPSGIAPAEARAQLEYQLARALSIEVPAAQRVLIVDHAWVKDAPSSRARTQQRKAMEKLRGLVVAGATIPAAFAELGVDGTTWHIGDHETYGVEVVGPQASELPAGGLSPIFAGDGGLHLFKIHEHREQLPLAAGIRDALRVPLRQDKRIELFDEK